MITPPNLILGLSLYITITTAFTPKSTHPAFGILDTPPSKSPISSKNDNNAHYTFRVPLTTSTTTTLHESSTDNNNEEEEYDGGSLEDIPLARLLGVRRLKKMRRKFKTERNRRIRNSELIQDENGDWMEATPEQMAEMRKSSADVDVVFAEEKNTLKIIIAGAPASGKGTQCEIIQEKYDLVHLSTGDMLRAAVQAETEVGKLAKEYMDNGKLVPDDVIIGVVRDRLNEADCIKKGWLLDGFPRTPAQASALSESGIQPDCFLFLDVPDESLVERVVGRRTDPKTGKIYHLKFSPPPEDDDELLERLVQRSDDTEEKVKVRLEQFHANVDAVKGSYSKIMATIDGTSSPSEVSSSIDGVIESLKKVST